MLVQKREQMPQDPRAPCTAAFCTTATDVSFPDSSFHPEGKNSSGKQRGGAAALSLAGEIIESFWLEKTSKPTSPVVNLDTAKSN